MDKIAVTHDKLLLFWGLHKSQTSSNTWGCPIAIYKDYVTSSSVGSLRIYNKVKVYFTIGKKFPSVTNANYVAEISTTNATNVPIGSINTDMPF